MPIEHHEGGTMITGHDDIRRYQLLALWYALRVEVGGLTRHGRSASVVVREVTGLTTRNKAKLLLQYEEWLKDKGVIA